MVERVGGERVASLACKVNFLALPRKDLKFEIKDQETTPTIKDSPLNDPLHTSCSPYLSRETVPLRYCLILFRGETLRMRSMRQGLQPQRRPGETQAHTYGRKALLLYRVCQNLYGKHGAHQTPADTYSREGNQCLCCWKQFILNSIYSAI